MSTESEPGAIQQYDLENTTVNWEEIQAKKEDDDRWSFTVRSRQEGRKLALIFAQELSTVIGFDLVNQVRKRLEDPDPIDDCRIAGQTSFSEYDEDFNSKGAIELVEIYVRNSREDQTGLANFKRAIQPIVEKTGRS